MASQVQARCTACRHRLLHCRDIFRTMRYGKTTAMYIFEVHPIKTIVVALSEKYLT